MSAQTEAVVQLADLIKQSIQANAEVARALNEHRIKLLRAQERNNLLFVAAFREIYRLDPEQSNAFNNSWMAFPLMVMMTLP